MPRTGDKVEITYTENGGGDLCGPKLASTILEVERTRIPRWTKLGKMPAKLGQLDSGPVWYLPDIEEMARRRKARLAKGDGDI